MSLNSVNKFLIFLCYLLFYMIQGISSDEFTVVNQNVESVELTPISSVFMALSVSVSETLPQGTLMYIVSWTTPLSKEPSLDDNASNTAADYVDYKINSEENKIEFNVNQSMATLIDYGNQARKTTLILSLNFDFIDRKEPYRLEITHTLIDENTQTPSFEQSSYDVSLREDFPTDLPIPGLDLLAHDYDANSPNNEFEVFVDKNCPIQPIQSSYKCENGVSVPVQFVLSQPLDYDVMEDPFTYVCSVTLLNDLNDSPLSSVTKIQLAVEPSRDEYPVFSSNYYKGSILDSTECSMVDVSPKISAYDADQPPSKITYSMKSVENSIEAEKYLEIDPVSGDITIIQDLDSEFLSYLQINFFLTACDEDVQCTTALLVMVLNEVACDLSFPKFDKVTYTAELISPDKGEVVLKVHAQTSESQEDLIYYFAFDTPYFAIDKISGTITTTKADIEPDLYTLIAMVTDGTNTDQTTVNVEILLGKERIILMDESVTWTTVAEDFIGSLLTVHAEGANMYCMESIIPNYRSDSLRLDPTSGELEVISLLDVDLERADVDNLFTTLIFLKIAAYKNAAECKLSEITTHLESYESLVIIFISDVNEYPPYFVDISGVSSNISQLVYAYPQNEELRKTLGPVAKVLVEDPDRTSSLSFSLSGSSEFVIDEKSGELYHVAQGEKSNENSFCIVIDDTKFQEELMVEVTSLDFDHIFTLNFIGMDMKSLQQTLEDMSFSTKMSIYLLYANVIGTQVQKASTANNWNIEANVYATYNFKLVDLEEFNKYLDMGGVDYIKAVAFRDRITYETIDPTPVAAIVLGTILGLLLLILAFVGFCYCCNQSKQKQKKSSTLKVRTLGQVYDGPHLKEAEITGKQDSLQGSYTNGQDDSGSQVKDVFSENLYPILLMEEEPSYNQPLSQVATQYESEINEAAHSIKKSLESNPSKNSSHTDRISGNSSVASRRENFLNFQTFPAKASVEEEPKSVAFKVLVDVQEPEQEMEKFGGRL